MPRGIYVRTKPAWNKGLTKETDERIAKIAVKLTGKVPWSKGLTAETDERLARMIKTQTGRRKSEAHKMKISVGVRRWWARLKVNDPELWKARLAAWHATTAEYYANLQEETADRLRAEYGLPDDAVFTPVRYSEHRFARALVGSKLNPRFVPPARAGQVPEDVQFYYQYKGGIFPVEDEEYGVVDGELVPLVTDGGVTKVRALLT